ncbi:hypothetical protein Pla175_46990 [Pirellulimonas nuda]|uniref:Putative restriction endonuclease domain-containing protein n=1 Tax=Pirellulimonas nuda TaxID=2528009 RepID=A0A518DII2_9BACT|nr:Uma2 family endonuclease [Pirellulimonas nuda]QDU91278.1 hypothetical protein Pla175_46990 [Pirellulimonas nuda]
MSAIPNTYLTADQYLARERASLEQKHEFYRGEMFAMAGASRQHSRLTFALNTLIGSGLKGKPCEGHGSDMRVKVDPSGLYTYPDLSVVCGEPAFEDEHLDTLLNPQLIVEVLSPSTETYDRGKKFEHYRKIASLREYVLVAQDRPHIERFVRQEDGSWNLTEANGIDASITLALLDLPLALSDVYEKVEFDEADSAPETPAAAPADRAGI